MMCARENVLRMPQFGRRRFLNLIVVVSLLCSPLLAQAQEVDYSPVVSAAKVDFQAGRFMDAARKLLGIQDLVDAQSQWKVRYLMGVSYCSAKAYNDGFIWLTLAALDAPEDSAFLAIMKLRSMCREQSFTGGEVLLAGVPNDGVGGEARVQVMMCLSRAIDDGISGSPKVKADDRQRVIPSASQELVEHHLDVLGTTGRSHWLLPDDVPDLRKILGEWPRAYVTSKQENLSVHSTLGMPSSGDEELAKASQHNRYELSGKLHWFNFETIDVYLFDEAFWRGFDLAKLLGVDPNWTGYFLIAPKQGVIIFRAKETPRTGSGLSLNGPDAQWLAGQLYALLALMNSPTAPPWLVSGGADYFANVPSIRDSQSWTSPEQLFLALVTLPGVSLVAPLVFLNLRWKDWNRVNKTTATGFAGKDLGELALPLDMHRFTAYLFVAFLVRNGWFDPLWHAAAPGEEAVHEDPRFPVEQVTGLSTRELTHQFANWMTDEAAPLLLDFFPDEKPFGGL